MLRRSAAHLLRDLFGRPLDDLDKLRLRIAARDLAAREGKTAYAVCSADGWPMLGLHNGTPAAEFTAHAWRRAEAAP